MTRGARTPSARGRGRSRSNPRLVPPPLDPAPDHVPVSLPEPIVLSRGIPAERFYGRDNRSRTPPRSTAQAVDFRSELENFRVSLMAELAQAIDSRVSTAIGGLRNEFAIQNSAAIIAASNNNLRANRENVVSVSRATVAATAVISTASQPISSTEAPNSSPLAAEEPSSPLAPYMAQATAYDVEVANRLAEDPNYGYRNSDNLPPRSSGFPLRETLVPMGTNMFQSRNPPTNDPVLLARRNEQERQREEIDSSRYIAAANRPLDFIGTRSDNTSLPGNGHRSASQASNNGQYSAADSRRAFGMQPNARPQTYAQVKAPKRPAFKERTDPYSFIKRIMQYGREMGLHLDQLFFDILPQCFEEETANHWFETSRYKWVCWQDFVNDLYQTFTRPDEQRALASQAMTVCQRQDEDPVDFALRKDEQLSRYVPQFNEATRISTIVGLLLPEYGAQLASRVFADFYELKNALVVYRAAICKTGRHMPLKVSTNPSEIVETIYVPPKKVRFPEAPNKVFYKKNTGKDELPAAKVSTSAKNPSRGQPGPPILKSPEKRAPRATGITCYRCYRQGHISRDCTFPPAWKAAKEKIVALLESICLSQASSEESESSDEEAEFTDAAVDLDTDGVLVGSDAIEGNE